MNAPAKNPRGRIAAGSTTIDASAAAVLPTLRSVEAARPPRRRSLVIAIGSSNTSTVNSGPAFEK